MKLRLLFLLSLIALLSQSVRAEFTFEYEGNSLIYEVIDENAKTCRVVDHDLEYYYTHGKMNTDLVIPSIANNYYVTEIGDKAFYNDDWITSLILPNTITKIGNNAFSYGPRIGNLVIPNSVTSIGDWAFYGSGLTSVVIPNSVTTIGGYAFGSNPRLTHVEIPNSLTKIDGSTFVDCIKLSSVEIPNSITEIGGQAFMNCENLTSIYIPESVTRIRLEAFKGCSGLTMAEFASIKSLCNIEFEGENSNPLSQAHHLFINGEEIIDLDIPNTIVSIGSQTFSGCSSLKSIYIPSSVKSLALTDCSGLTSIDIPNTVTSLALRGCSGLTSIDIPNSVKEIGPFAFYDCTGLTSIRIPNSVTSIYDWAFSGCEKLETIIFGCGLKEVCAEVFKDCPIANIYITAPKPPKIYANTFNDYSGTVHLQGEASAVAYGNDEVWGKFKREFMIEPTGLTIDGASYVSGEPGETFQLKADIYPADVTLPYIYWRSTNPRIATVDNNGLVTLLRDEDEKEDKTRAEENDSNDNSCKIIAESLYYDGPIAEVTVYNSNFNGVGSVMEESDEGTIDYSRPFEIYNMNGMKVGESMDGLVKGIYIVRQDKLARKIGVK